MVVGVEVAPEIAAMAKQPRRKKSPGQRLRSGVMSLMLGGGVVVVVA